MRKAETMSSCRQTMHTFGVLAAASIAMVACNGSAPEGHYARTVGPEIVELRLPGDLERPPVEFNHEKHTKSLQQEGCKACHLRDRNSQGKILPRLWEAAAPTVEADKDRFHDRCMGCHTERKKAGKKTGPVTCGECHVRRQPPLSRRQAVAFNYALHEAHVKATEKKCITCHRFYDEQKKKMVYREGVQGGPGDFHGVTEEKEKLAIRLVAHQTCINCHLEKERSAKGPGEKTGPTTCSGCHSGKVYKPGLSPKVIERLVENQPERTWIKAPGVKSRLVGFNHKLHEPLVGFCSTCHHRTLKACKECHTLTGKREGNGVTMEMAYHKATSEHSCVGCHKQKTDERDCSGCHHRLGPPPGLRSCNTCHSGPKPAKGTSLPAATMPTSLPTEVKLAALPATSDDLPEKVVIKDLAQKYGPSNFPHRKIVARLDTIIRKSKVAATFHGSTDALCAGCHHQSPIGRRPQPCKACHDKTGHPKKDKPSLLNAYHRQCIGCHQKMAIKTVGCTDCHKDKQASKEVSR